MTEIRKVLEVEEDMCLSLARKLKSAQVVTPTGEQKEKNHGHERTPQNRQKQQAQKIQNQSANVKPAPLSRKKSTRSVTAATRSLLPDSEDSSNSSQSANDEDENEHSLVYVKPEAVEMEFTRDDMEKDWGADIYQSHDPLDGDQDEEEEGIFCNYSVN